MDPVSIIVTALGVVASKVGDQAITDGYAGLKALVVRKFGSRNPKLAERMDEYVADPETFEKPMIKAIEEAHVAEDQDVMDRAVELLKQGEAVQPGITGGLVGQINAEGGRVVVAHSVGTINM